MKKTLNYILTVSLIWSLLFVASCSKDDPAPSENDYVNSWILGNMKQAYYWTDQIPTSPNKEQVPDAFFKSLLSSEDRFSWIQNNYQDLLNALQGVSKEAGYEFTLYRASSTANNVFAQITYIKKVSPAEAAGLKRGDAIDQINNKQITIDNFQTLLQEINSDHSITYRPYDLSTNSVGTSKTISLSTVEYAENPNFLNTVITVNNRKIGYYVYNLFSTGPTSASTQYNDEMDAVFAGFKSAGITDLVLDLRFNSGGAETATINLASLIGKGVDETKVFAKRQYNATLTSQILNDPSLGTAFLSSKFKIKSQNIGQLLRNGRVYILTGSRTASASELLINGLRPYMSVFLIGRQTLGKNVGSTSIYKPDDLKNKWGMQPIIVKSFNSLDQSDYGTGFIPDIKNDDNEAQRPLGDPSETLLSLAIANINASGRIGRTEKTLGEPLGYSADVKPRNKELIVEFKKIN